MAQEFRLVGGNGKGRAALALMPDGRSRLVFTGRNGKRRAYFGLEKDGTPYLLFAGPDGKQRIGIDFQDGEPRLERCH